VVVWVRTGIDFVLLRNMAAGGLESLVGLDFRSCSQDYPFWIPSRVEALPLGIASPSRGSS